MSAGNLELEKVLEHKLNCLEERFALIARAYAANTKLLATKQTTIEQLQLTVAHLQGKLSEVTSPAKAIKVHSNQDTQATRDLPNGENSLEEATRMLALEKKNQRRTSEREEFKDSFPSKGEWTCSRPNPSLPQREQKDTKEKQCKEKTPGLSIHQAAKMDFDVMDGTSQEGGNLRELQSIWQQRDRELGRMDQLFENLKHRLEEYQ